MRMLGAPATTVVTGQGLGPDLRVPVPFVMARRTGTVARFVALYDVCREPAIKRVESAPGVFQVTMSAARDEISAAPKNSPIGGSEAHQ